MRNEEDSPIASNFCIVHIQKVFCWSIVMDCLPKFVQLSFWTNLASVPRFPNWSAVHWRLHVSVLGNLLRRLLNWIQQISKIIRNIVKKAAKSNIVPGQLSAPTASFPPRNAAIIVFLAILRNTRFWFRLCDSRGYWNMIYNISKDKKDLYVWVLYDCGVIPGAKEDSRI